MDLNGIQSVLIVTGAVSAADGFHINVRLSGAGILSGDAEEGNRTAAGSDHILRIDLGEGTEDHIGKTLGGCLTVEAGRRLAGTYEGAGIADDLDAVEEAGVGGDRFVQQALY